MLSILDAVVFAIGACYLLRWSYYVIVKRQRLDWGLEREGFKQGLKLMLRIMHRLMRYYWRGWHSK